MWHVVDYGGHDYGVIHDNAVDELENDFGPNLGVRLVKSFNDKCAAENFLDILCGEHPE